MAQATKEELDAMENDETKTDNKYFGSALTEDELKCQVEELNELMDPTQLTTIQQHCIAQIVACFIANHIHRYYHAHKYVATISNKLNNLNMNINENKQNDDDDDDDDDDELHLIYPIPILKAPHFNDNNNNNNNNIDDEIGFTMSSIIKQPNYYCNITSTHIIWAKSFLQSFCEYLNVPKTQIMGYLYFIENAWIDPEPFFETLKWKNDKNNLLRIPLLLLQFAISHNGYYDARLRSLLKSIISYCNIEWQNEFIIREYSFGIVLHVLLQKKEAKSSTKNYGRWAKIGAVGVISGVLIAVTGGLAAPAVAAGLGAIGLTATGTFLLTTTGTATLYLLFGVTGAGYAGLKMHNTVSEIKDFKFISLSSSSSSSSSNQDLNEEEHNGLNVIITINGWLQGIDDDEEKKKVDDDENDDNDDDDDADIESRDYWIQILSDNGNIHLRSDCYTLQFEKKCLLSLGEGLKKFVAKRAVTGTVSTAAQATLGYTAFATLVTALTWPVALIAAAGYIDNPWSKAFVKTKEAGLVLADCLASGNHGRRPVTLIGYSLGARVIFYALKELVKRYNHIINDKKEEEDQEEDESAFSKFMKKRKEKQQRERTEREEMDLSSIIENVIIFGAPCTCDIEEWNGIRKIVSDRIINCYSINDWVLKFVYRTAAATTSVAGLMPIQCDGIENLNLSNCIDGHSQYYDKTGKLLKYLIDSCGLYFMDTDNELIVFGFLRESTKQIAIFIPDVIKFICLSFYSLTEYFDFTTNDSNIIIDKLDQSLKKIKSDKHIYDDYHDDDYNDDDYNDDDDDDYNDDDYDYNDGWIDDDDDDDYNDGWGALHNIGSFDNTTFGNIKIDSMNDTIYKWYIKIIDGGSNTIFGITSKYDNIDKKNYLFYQDKISLNYSFSGKRKCFQGEWKNYGRANNTDFTINDEICIELDLKKGQIVFYINDKWQGIVSVFCNGTWLKVTTFEVIK